MSAARRSSSSRARSAPTSASTATRTSIYRFCTELLTEHFVSDETFAEAHELFGSQGCVDIIGTLGNYSMLAFCLNAFQVDLQPDREPPYPDIRGYARVARPVLRVYRLAADPSRPAKRGSAG